MSFKTPVKKIIIKLLQKHLVKILHAISQNHIKNGEKQMAIYSFDTISHSINTWGSYERPFLNALDLWLIKKFPEKKKLSVLDIGANIGNHTVFFAERFLKTFAYEPVLKNFKLLKLNTENIDNVETFNFGISDTNEETVINVSKENMGGSSVVCKPLNTTSIEKIKLKNLNEENILNEKIGLVKIDTEGMEHQVLLGINEIIKRDQPIIWFEENIYEKIIDGSSTSINFLKSVGYSSFYTFKKKKKRNLIARVFDFLYDEIIEIVKIEKIKKKDYCHIVIALV